MAVTEIPSWAVFAPGLTRARVVNTGPVDPSANVGDGLNGRGPAMWQANATEHGFFLRLFANFGLFFVVFCYILLYFAHIGVI